MTDPARSPDTREDTSVSPGGASPPGMPRWVKISLLIVAALVAAFLILKVAGVGGEHGPGRHLGPAGGGAKISDVSEHRPPPGVPDHR